MHNRAMSEDKKKCKYLEYDFHGCPICRHPKWYNRPSSDITHAPCIEESIGEPCNSKEVD